MDNLSALITTTLAIGFGYTFFGMDHYLPIVALSKTNGWSNRKTLWVVIACGAGHVASSLALGLAGIGLSAGLTTLMDIQELRGLLATWLLILFGAAYFLWGLRVAFRHKAGGGHAHGGAGPAAAGRARRRRARSRSPRRAARARSSAPGAGRRR